MTILVFVAHPDDEIIGAGATIAKYTQKGKEVISIIFSYGEGSDPLMKPSLLTSSRIAESKRAGRILGCTNIVFLGLSDLKFIEGLGKPFVGTKVKHLLEEYNPEIIFTHCPDDPHPHHRAVANFVKEIVDTLHIKTKIYTFTISSPIRILHRGRAKLYIDVSSSFDLKKKAIKTFKSQWRSWLAWYYYPLAIIKARIAGLKAGCRYAEVFYKW